MNVLRPQLGTIAVILGYVLSRLVYASFGGGFDASGLSWGQVLTLLET